MNPWTIEQLAGALEARVLTPGARGCGGAVRIDSRLAQAGDLFVAIRGDNHNSHRYVGDVILRNAGAIVIHEIPAPPIVAAARQHGVALLMADDTVAALNALAAAYRKTLRGRVIAIAGSNGKTTTKRMLDAILSERFHGHASPKSFNNNIGVPLTLLDAAVEQEYVILEIGTNAPGEIAMLGAVCRPDLAVITSIGLEHLELLIDLPGVAHEEAAIANFLPGDGLLVIPAESAELRAALRHAKARTITVGLGDGDVDATDIRCTLDGSTFISGGSSFDLPLLGRHNVSNALAALAIAREMGMDDAAIARGLKRVEPADMRLMPVRIGSYRVINDAYNANPSSMATALGTFAALPPGDSGRRVAILGDMLELGAQGPAFHLELGERAVTAGLALLIAVGPLMKHAARAARAGGVEARDFATSAEAAAALAELLQPGDAILLKGSRGMRIEQILVPLRAAEGAPDGEKKARGEPRRPAAALC